MTGNPTAEWIARQIIEAFPWDSASPYLIRDRDTACGVAVTEPWAYATDQLCPARRGRTVMLNGWLDRSDANASTMSWCSGKRTFANCWQSVAVV